MSKTVPSFGYAGVDAARVHAANLYAGQQTYKNLEACVEVLRRFGVTDRVVLCSAWLQHALMVSDADFESVHLDLSIGFGHEVVQAVSVLSMFAPGGYDQVRGTPAAILVVLAMRIAFLEKTAMGIIAGSDSRADGDRLRRVFQDFVVSHHELRQGLCAPGSQGLTEAPGTAPLWSHLDWLLYRLPQAMVGRSFSPDR